jgi:type VI secretion system secreted protein Hcp
MADTISLFLKANGTDIEGETSVLSQGRDKSIEVLSFEDGVETAREKGSGMATGRRTYKPIKITCRIGKQTPLIAKALRANETIDAVFKFYRPHPEGTGEQQHYYTIELAKGRVSDIRRVSQDTLDPARSERPPTEEIGFVFHTITHTHEVDGKTDTDEWSNA